jgi:glyoxylate reductase
MAESYRVFATCDIGQEALQRLRDRAYELEVYDQVEPPSRALVLDRVGSGIDGLITTLRDQIDEEVFRQGSGTLRVIAQDAVGFDNIDRQAANRFKIPFTNTADVLTHATAEFAFFILGCVSRKLFSSEHMVRESHWKTWHPSEPFLGDEVTGKSIGVIGTGRIGKAFISKCSGFDVDILCCDALEDRQFLEGVRKLLEMRRSLNLARRMSSIRYAPLDEVLERADYVSLHLPLTDETHHLVGEPALRRMNSSAYLINTSRGSVVDEAALYKALKRRWIAGAALDVFETEPLPGDSVLRDPSISDRLRLFHHFASATKETRLSPDPAVGMAGRCVQGLIDVLEENYDGDPKQMPYVVNKEAF